MKRWFWNEQDRVYVDEEGDELDDSELREGIDQYIESLQSDFNEKAAQFAAGAITLTALFTFLENQISAMHGAAGSIAYGGLNQMDLQKWERINERLQSELGYLKNFKLDVAQAQNIVTPEEPFSEEGIANRAGMYAEAAYSEYMKQVLAREEDSGITLGRRICEDDPNSCQDCIDAASDEFVPLDEIPEIGSLTCMQNCRCTLDFSTEGIFNPGSQSLTTEAVQ